MVSAPSSEAQARFIQACELYVATFAGRTDAYSVWTGDAWRAIRKELTADVAANAFLTNIPISGYVLGTDNMTHVAALDIDRDDGFDLGREVMKQIRRLGGVAYIEASRRGCHVWIVMTERRPGILVRRALIALCAEAGLPVDPKIELRPGSDRIPEEGGLGHCLRLPTMPHQRTGQRYALTSSDGMMLPGRVPDMMLEIDWCPVMVIDSLAERAPLPKLGPPPRGLRHSYGDPIVGEQSASEILRERWGALNAAPGKAIRCPAHDDEHPSLSILKDDQRAICRSPSCILHNNGRGRGTHELATLRGQG